MPEAARSLVVIQAADDELQGRVIPIGDQLCVGRRAGAGIDLVIDDKLLSSKHATLTRGERGYQLVDHDSKNGSFVDGARVAGSERLADGALVRFGVHLFELSRDAGPLRYVDASADGDPSGALVGHSLAVRAVVDALETLAASPGAVLFVGEHGTGKEAAARRVHVLRKKKGEFIAADGSKMRAKQVGAQLFGDVDGDAIGLGIGGTVVVGDGRSLLQRAVDGTLLLEAIDALELDVQKRLARALEGTGIDLCGTTEVDLDALVEDGSFARELYELMAPRTLELPALRARRCDVPLLARHFWAAFAPGRKLEFSATCLEKLCIYDWPMNVRELRGVVERLAHAEGGAIETLRSAHLPAEIRERGEKSLDALKFSGISVQLAPSRDQLAKLLERFKGDVLSVAQFYARDKRQVLRWLKRHDLKVADFRPR